MTEQANHLDLSTFVKKVHEDLRKQSHLLGDVLAWKSHCLEETKLKEYAIAMKDLSCKVWESNFTKSCSKATSRIIWTVEACVNYFNGSIESCRQKEYAIIKKYSIELRHTFEQSVFSKKWKLLDVGSCYNPFKRFEYFEVTAIDIAPATDDVFKCDFLNVDIGDLLAIEYNSITRFQSNSFDVIVFSLLLEYLPSPKQRLMCCERAYELLRTEGLLIIITPDSKHVGANAKIMKSWRFIMAKLGFSRIKYEKLPHLHCMVFRKSFDVRITLNWACLYQKEQTYDEMCIPQDFTKILISLDDQILRSEGSAEIAEGFTVLPYGD